MHRGLWLLLATLAGCFFETRAEPAGVRISTFRADVTPPAGHPLCGGLVPPATRVADPLDVRGFVLWGGPEPIVYAALDWTELRNDAYERWREELARAAGTRPRNVLVSCVHQHDAPYADLEAQRLLDGRGVGRVSIDPGFHERAVRAAASAVCESLPRRRRVTHVGIGEAPVERIASNRRVVLGGGHVTFARYSRTGNAEVRDAPEGTIDPNLKTLSFWDGDRPVAALSVYATHPMSVYRTGAVSADFPGVARAKRQAEAPDVFQIYATGCSGDVTAGKYNGGDLAARQELGERLRAAMALAWERTRRIPLERILLRIAELSFELPAEGPRSVATQEAALADPAAPLQTRIEAAFGLSWAKRRDRSIDVPSVDLGPAQLLLLPAESFVEFQLAAQRLRPDQFIVTLGYGECAPGYIPTEEARAEGFVREHGYSWVAAGAEARLRTAIAAALGVK